MRNSPTSVTVVPTQTIPRYPATNPTSTPSTASPSTSTVRLQRAVPMKYQLLVQTVEDAVEDDGDQRARECAQGVVEDESGQAADYGHRFNRDASIFAYASV